MHETRNSTDAYKYEMTNKDHEKLIEILENIEGKVMLSGYENELYNTLNWKKYMFDVPIRAGMGKRGKGIMKKKTETIWYNYDLSNIEPQQIQLF